jgi:hypothetical protein
MDELSPQLRDEYRKKLLEKGSEWIGVPAFLAGCVLVILLLDAVIGGSDLGLWGLAATLIGGAVVAGAAIVWWMTYRKQVIAPWPDDLLVHKYTEYQAAKHRHRIWGVAAGVVAAAAVVLTITVAANNPAETALILSDAHCNIVTTNTEPGVFIVNGAPDAGYNVVTQIRNSGKTGRVRIGATLSTSEGQFVKEQELELAADETQDLTFGFSEPTINASNIQSTVTCRP